MHRLFVNTAQQRFITIGIIGGGQLALMLARAASQLGLKVRVLDPSPAPPARSAVGEFRQGDWNNLPALRDFARGVDIITVENEFVPAAHLAELERIGHTVVPSSHTMHLVQDKLTQKQKLRAAGIPVIDFRPVVSESSGSSAGASLGYPFVLKRRTLGYDGTGNRTVREPDEIAAAVQELGGFEAGLYAEKWCHFERELAVIIVRSINGETKSYPVVESCQMEHVCASVIAPADVPEEIDAAARDLALRAVASVDGAGVFGVELFQMEDGSLFVNELAPRVHNSGHYTIEACDCSQFENHIRAILGLPLGSTAQHHYAAMVNLLATVNGSGAPHGIADALAVPHARVHIYGKLQSTPGRKMGHITALGNSRSEAIETATKAASAIHFET